MQKYKSFSELKEYWDTPHEDFDYDSLSNWELWQLENYGTILPESYNPETETAFTHPRESAIIHNELNPAQ